MTNRPNKVNETKPRDAGDPMYEELRVVRDQVQEVLGVLTYLARDPEVLRRHKDEMCRFFTRNRSLARLYLALSVDRNITQVAHVLGVSRQAVQQGIWKLDAARMILKKSAGGRGDVWIRNPTLEQVVHLSALIRTWLPDLEPVAPTPEEAALNEAATETTE